MPNRILKESVCTSEKVNELTDFQFRLWAHLITYVDDFGRGDARPSVIQGRCFPLRLRKVSVKHISDGLEVLAEKGCIRLYEVDGGRYFCFPSWGKHQTVRNKKSKFPEPPEADCGQLKTIASNCKQMQANVPVIQSNTYSESKSYSEAESACAREGDRLILYATDNLKCLSANNLAELDSFREQLSDEMITWAIDETCAHGSRNYGYLKAILNRMIDQGLKTIGDVKAYEEKRRREKQQPDQLQRAKKAAKPMDERAIDPAEFEPDYSELMNRPRSGGAA